MAFRNEDHSDMTQFGNRLWHLMDRHHYSSARQLATDLYDLNLAKVKSNPDKCNSDADIRKNAIGSIEKKIDRHIKSSDPSSVKGEFLVAYSKLFGCSADYLLGFTDITTDDPEIRRMCELTGLSENALVRLVDCSREYGYAPVILRYWSELIESDLFETVPHDMSAASRMAEKYIECTSAVQARAAALENEDPSSDAYYMLPDEKTLESPIQGHYAAYYGLLHKLSQDITSAMDALIQSQLTEDKFYEKTLEQMKKQFRYQLMTAKGEQIPPDEQFEFHRHVIF